MSKEKNRQEFPETARIVDAYRECFAEARLVWARENGKEIGTKDPRIAVPISPEWVSLKKPKKVKNDSRERTYRPADSGAHENTLFGTGSGP